MNYRFTCTDAVNNVMYVRACERLIISHFTITTFLFQTAQTVGRSEDLLTVSRSEES